MDFIEKLQALSVRVPRQIEHCQTEEATKNALILPFISALGYDVFNPTEVVPEFTADIGTKKGEKVDYAILQDEHPIILFECKWSGADLNKEHASQLFRYFAAVPEVRFGVLTNGVSYRFYSDLEAPNRLDDRPFFEFNVMDFDERQVLELKKFTNSYFDLEEILTTASELKYTAAVQRIISVEFDEPSEDFVRYFASQVYSGRMTKAARVQFSDIVKKALRRFLNDEISARLKTALNNADRAEAPNIISVPVSVSNTEDDLMVDDDDGIDFVRQDKARGIYTTEEEIEGFFAVKSILRGAIEISRVHMRDGKAYCSVLLDDNNRKPICRFRFDGAQKYLGLLDADKKETRISLDSVDDVYHHSDQILDTVKRYDESDSVPVPDRKPSIGRSTLDDRPTYTGTKPSAVVFLGHRSKVSSWKEAMFAFLSDARSQDPSKFDGVAVQMVGRKRPYITAEKEKLRSAKLIPGSHLYVETNMDAAGIVKLCCNIADAMDNGYDAPVFEIEDR